MKIGIGCDFNGFDFKEEIKKHLEATGHEVVDFGSYSSEPNDYPEVAFNVAEAVSEKKVERGILICGTGIGVQIAANKYPGIRAAQCHDTYSAERAQLSNNAQIITMGAKIIGPEVGKDIVDAYLSVSWAEGSARKVNQILEKEEAIVAEQYKEKVRSEKSVILA